MRSLIGVAVAPADFKIVAEPPALEEEADLQNLIGKTVLVGWQTAKVMGWYLGAIHSRKLSPTDLKATPTANFVVKYTNAKTNKKINGNVACELTTRKYGPSEWWVLLEKA